MTWILLLASPTFAAPDSGLELRWGVAARLRDDEVFTEIPYRGVTPVHGGLALSIDGDRLVHRMDLAFDHLAARTGPDWQATFGVTDAHPVTVGATPFTRVRLDYAVGGAVVDRERWALDVGGASLNRIDSTPYNLGWTSVFGYCGSFGVGPWARLRGEVAGARGSVATTVPVVAWIARSPYAANDDPYIAANRSHEGVASFFGLMATGAPEAIVPTFAPRLDGALAVPVSERFDLVAHADVALVLDATPRALTDLSAALSVGAAVRF